jgi:uncharacterized membrane protein YqjE
METTRFRNPAGRAGLFGNLLALTNTLAIFVESRFALFAKESKTALGQLIALIAATGAALLLFAFGYVFLIGSAVFALARIAEMSWISISLIAAGVHFLLAIVCLLVARAMMKKPPFRETLEELKKDREWLRNLDETSRTN